MFEAPETLSDPGGTSLVQAVDWLTASLLGAAATAIAVFAVAWIGFRMLSGRIEVRRSVTTIIGCFLLFCAFTVASGLRALTDGATTIPPAAAAVTPAVPVTDNRAPGISPPAYDPYAGAAVPERR